MAFVGQGFIHPLPPPRCAPGLSFFPLTIPRVGDHIYADSSCMHTNMTEIGLVQKLSLFEKAALIMSTPVLVQVPLI